MPSAVSKTRLKGNRRRDRPFVRSDIGPNASVSESGIFALAPPAARLARCPSRASHLLMHRPILPSLETLVQITNYGGSLLYEAIGIWMLVGPSG